MHALRDRPIRDTAIEGSDQKGKSEGLAGLPKEVGAFAQHELCTVSEKCVM